MKNELAPIIAARIAGTKPNSKQRMDALKSVQWVLAADNGLYAGLRGLDCALVPPEEALIFDGRDNEELKVRYYQAALKTNLILELV